MAFKIKPLQRQFLPKDFAVTTWEALKPYADNLLERQITNLSELAQFLLDESEFERILGQDMALRYIATSCNTADKAVEANYNDFIENIQPQLSEFGNAINSKILTHPLAKKFEQSGFDLMRRHMQDGVDIFRPENIDLQTQETQITTKYQQLKGGLTIDWEGKKLTISEAADLLLQPNRDTREKAWRAMRDVYGVVKTDMDDVYNNQVDIRQKIATNADFDNYQGYIFKAKHRHDYTPQDCKDFHAAIEKTIVPVVSQFSKQRQKNLGVETLKPWDFNVNPQNLPPLKAFDNAEELVAKGIDMLSQIDPNFGALLAHMNDNNQLDLAARPNKAGGGYNYELEEKGSSFIFGSVTKNFSDVIFLAHEMGHATHNYMMQDLPLVGYKNYPMETAELAAMSMELLAFDHLDIFFKNPNDAKRAKREHLQDILEFFPYMAMVDSFQHTIYEQPDLSIEQRHDVWVSLSQRFQPDTDYTGLEHYRSTMWHRQGHIFEMPFYYIEYAMAQLGALQIWRNSKQDKIKTIEQYKYALSLGATKSIPEVYEAAGIKFDFSESMLGELMDFVRNEMALLAD